MMTPSIEAAFVKTQRHVSSIGWSDGMFAPRMPVGAEFDDLAKLPPRDRWSDAHRQLLLTLRQIRPQRKFAIVTMMCNDAPYICEWIAHHLAIGADQIFVYTNNNNDSTERALRWFQSHAPVTLLPMETAGYVDVQRKNYHHALFLLPELRLYEWTAFIDSDEFLLPDARFDHYMPNMLAAAPDDTDVILFPWHWRLWPVAFSPSPGLLAERFPHALHKEQFKSVTRLDAVVSMEQIHLPLFDRDAVIRDTLFAPVTFGANWLIPPKTGEGGWIEHFWTKSFAEFLVKKRRGEQINIADSNSSFRRAYETYFQWTQPLAPDNLSPWPAVMLDRTRERLAGFSEKPGYAALCDAIAAEFRAYTASVENDPALRELFSGFAGRAS